MWDEVTFHKSRRTKAWQDSEAQPEECKSTLQRDMLEYLLWSTPQGGPLSTNFEGSGGVPLSTSKTPSIHGQMWKTAPDAKNRALYEVPRNGFDR